MGTVRPYFKLGVADLESIFEAAPAEKNVCQALVDELRHRNTDRSATLLSKIEHSLAAQVQRASPSSAPSERLTPALPTQAKAAPKQDSRPTYAAPPITNKPASVLAAWVALEALSPQTYRTPADLANGDSGCVANINGQGLPWLEGERSRPKQQLYYQIVLGCVPMDRATDEFIKTFGDDEERGKREREKAAIAAVLVDRDGFLLAENAIAVSSFAWALPFALKGDLNGLGAWADSEKGLVEGLRKQLVKTNRDGNSLPLDETCLQRGFRWLVTNLGLPTGLYEEPSFVLRVFHYFKSKTPPGGRAPQLVLPGRSSPRFEAG